MAFNACSGVVPRQGIYRMIKFRNLSSEKANRLKRMPLNPENDNDKKITKETAKTQNAVFFF